MSKKIKNKSKKTKSSSKKKKDDLVKLSFSDYMKDFFISFKNVISTVIFRRTLALFMALTVISVGVVQSIHHKNVTELAQAMKVSPSGEDLRFSKSGVTMTFLPQYRSGNTFILPFKIGSMSMLSSDATNYEVQLQGTNKNISRQFRAKLIMYGSSGRGVILVNGPFNGFPMNIYLQSNKLLVDANDVSSDTDITEDMSEEDIKKLHKDKESSTMGTGNLEVGGKSIKVKKDVVATTVNPTADNVKEVKNIDLTSTPSEVYRVAIGNKDKRIIELNRARNKSNLKQLKQKLHEYELRMDGDGTIKDNIKDAVKKADEIAITSNGNQEDADKINEIMNQVGNSSANVEGSEDVDPNHMTEDQMNKKLEQEVDMSAYGEGTSSSDLGPVETLGSLRTTIMSVNQKEVIYAYQLKQLEKIINKQDGIASFARKYQIIARFK